MPSRQLDWILAGSDGQPILGTTHLPFGASAPPGVLVICHGFKGYKDYGFFPYLAEQATRHALAAVRFNFSHGGMDNTVGTGGGESHLFERPDLFQRDTTSRQIADLVAVASAIVKQRAPGIERADTPLVFFGHSRGGMVALLAASRLFEIGATCPPPRAVITAAAPDRAAHLSSLEVAELERDGYLASPSARTGQILRVGREWYTEVQANPQAFDPLAAIGRVRCPVLILHGERDETVPLTAAHALADAGQGRAKLHVVAGASHTFNAPNPMPVGGQAPPQTQELAALCCGAAVEALSG